MTINEEQYINEAYELLLKEKDIDCISKEVPILGRYADLAFLKDNNIYTIEFKINNCRKAFAQSKDHMLGADFCYICMPPRIFKDTFLEDLIKMGIGLFTFNKENNHPFEEIVKARKSKRKFEFAWQNTLNYCLKNSNVTLNDNPI